MIKALLTSVVIVLTSATIHAQTSGKLENLNLYHKDLIIPGNDSAGPFILPDSLIIVGSEKVWLDGRLLEPNTFTLNYIDGDIRFAFPVPHTSLIRIVYDRLPYPIRKRHFHRRMIVRASDSLSLFNVPAPGTFDAGPESETFGADLQKSGSIVRGITIGSNRDLKLDSGLRLQVNGKVASNIEVVASLTDQSTPIQPEGNTQTLQEIDKVFVQIKAPGIHATLGDYQLELSETEFSRYSRKLQGAMVETKLDNYDLVASGAVSRGKYFSASFTGLEGYQGPYQLKGDRGQVDILILAGTERVYVDGEPMTRGETNDYTIDYSSAQITFSRRRLITADSRITVDFQYSDEKFRRNLYSARFRSRLWEDKLKLGLTFLHEADDENNPLDFALSDEYRQVLARAGDNPDSAAVSGAKYVGPGQGRYQLQDEGYFVFVGPDSGDYNVSFSDVGQGNGAYNYRGSGVYEYAGSGQGRYAPILMLPTATRHHLFGINGAFAPLAMVQLSGELAVSRLDLNTYSSRNDEDNNGLAYNGRLAIDPRQLHIWGRSMGEVLLDMKIHRVNDRFADIDRTHIVEYNRRWDLPPESRRGELVREMKGQYRLKSGLTFAAEYGTIEKGNDFSSRRWQASSQIQAAKWPTLNYRIENIRKQQDLDRRTGSWLRQSGVLEHTLWKFRPNFNYQSEIKKENWSDTLNTGFKFEDIMAGIGFNPLARLALRARIGKRMDYDYLGNDAFNQRSSASTQQYGWELKNLGTFTGSMEFTHRVRSFSDPSQENKRTDLAELKMQYSPFKKAFSTDWYYQISNTAVAKKDRIFIKVSDGDGNYRFDEQLNEYVNVPYGDYVMRILTSDEFVPVVELKTDARLRFTPQRLLPKNFRNAENQKRDARWWFYSVLNTVSSETHVRIEEKSNEKDVWQIYRLNLEKYQNEQTTIFGNVSLRQDLFLFENNNKLSLRLRFLEEREKNNQFLEGGQDRYSRERSSRLITRFSEQTSSEINLINKQVKRMFKIAGRQDRDIQSNQATLDFSYRPRQPLELAFKSKFAREQDVSKSPSTDVVFYALEPRASYAFRGKGRLSANLEWAQVQATPANRIFPYELANGNRPGTSLRWGLQLDYRVSKNVQARMSYIGRKEADRGHAIHTGNAEMRAFF